MRMLCSEEGLEMKYVYILGVVSKWSNCLAPVFLMWRMWDSKVVVNQSEGFKL